MKRIVFAAVAFLALSGPALADLSPVVNRAFKTDRLRRAPRPACVSLAPSAVASPECLDLHSFVGLSR